MASSKLQDQTTEQSAEETWIQCIRGWYPELKSRTYFVPPLHFNRVPYSVKQFAGEKALVAQPVQDGPNQMSPSKRLKTKTPKSSSTSAGHESNSSLLQSAASCNPSPVYDKDVRDDRAQQRVLQTLMSLENKSPPEVMVVISQLQFGQYLREPSYAAAVAQFPRPITLPEHNRQRQYQMGDFDILIIHKKHGIITMEIKSVGDNFEQMNMENQQKNDIVRKKVTEATKQLIKAEIVLKHLVSDLKPDINITKTIALPNISSGQLMWAMNNCSTDDQEFYQCIGTENVNDAVKLCLVSDLISPSSENHLSQSDVGEWWQKLITSSSSMPELDLTVYERLVARFCGPATTIEVQSVMTPRIAVRTKGESVSETGERVARLVLHPQQIDILNQSPPRAFITGPPGTGKTVVLILMALNWLQHGYDVHVLSTCSESLAVTFAIEHQLQETKKMRNYRPSVHELDFNFEIDGQMETAVTKLTYLSHGRQLCVIADESSHESIHFHHMCDQLTQNVPDVFLCAASPHHKSRPKCLPEFKLTMPLRSPPSIVKEIMNTWEMRDREFYNYTGEGPVPTDGPSIVRIAHSDPNPNPGHTGKYLRDCGECGHQIVRVLRELMVDSTGTPNSPPRLQYRDVLIICKNDPTNSTSNGLLNSLNSHQIPVQVVSANDKNVIRDVACVTSDVVAVTQWRLVLGLERKVVFVENEKESEEIKAVSRCTSQLVYIDF